MSLLLVGDEEGSQEVLMNKMNEMLKLVSLQQKSKDEENITQQQQHFTIQQLEAVIKSSIAEHQDDKKPTRSHHTTQTSPVKAWSKERVFNEQASQTEVM